MPRHVELLRTLPSAMRLATIEATLPVAARAERDVFEDELLELVADRPARRWRRHDAAPLMSALRLWSVLSRPTKDALVKLGRRGWDSTLRSAVRDERPLTRANAARLMADLHAYDLSGLLLSLIADAHADVARVADVSMLQLATDLVGVSLSPDTPPPAPLEVDSTSRWMFERVVAEGIRRSATHRRRGVILAGVLMLDQAAIVRARAHGHATSPLHDALVDGTESSQMMLRAVVRRSKEPAVRARALCWLAGGPASTAAMDRLGVAYSLADHEGVLARSHLLARPLRARRVGMIGLQARPRPGVTHEPILEDEIIWPARACVPPPQVVAELSDRARAGLPAWCGAVRMNAAERALVLAPLATDEHPTTRHAMLRVAPRRLVGELCFDADARIAESAIRHWSLVGEHGVPGRPEDARLVRRLQRSPHEGVRRVAGEEAARLDPWNPREAASRLAARRALTGHRERFIEQLRVRLDSAQAAERIDAMLLARQLGICGEIELELLRAVTGDIEGLDENENRWRVAATAVGALAAVGTPTAREALIACLSHGADRVRANAVEAVASMHRRHEHVALAHQVTELKGDPNHRVRANVLRELLRGGATRGGWTDPASAQCVADMLADQRPMHRVAGLWVTERLLPTGRSEVLKKRWAELSVRVAEMAREDDDERVRARGGRCARRLLAHMRSGWRHRAPALEVDHQDATRGAA